MVSIHTKVRYYGLSGYDKNVEYRELVNWLLENIGTTDKDWALNTLPGGGTEIILWDNNKATLAQLRWAT